ncbi:hypothetical protein E9531_09650 [Lampropedia puyangensis]|uniref:Fimbrial assembly protein n=1 Tax=Lampropedia puyangensis TaxID=1330072 RepID=A0A4S8F192_9BURK|nr:PilN domain-containing protein [Lampropedia puyangensis]THU01038.1 hypothetical protein E9531_09650 [Lampropedia puyangensis]
MSASTPSPNQASPSPWVLFGLDLSTIGQDWLHAMRQLYRLPPLRWFELNPRIGLLREDGNTAHWQSNRIEAANDQTAQPTSLWAVELPETLLLRRTLSLPDLPAAQIQDAVALDLLSSSPFPADDIAWGFVQTPSDTGTHIQAAFASRTQIAKYLLNIQERYQWPNASSEIWAFAPGSAEPIVLQGYGESIAERARNARRTKTAFALLTFIGLLCALAITPTLQIRHQAIQADQAYQSLVAQTKTLTQERASLTKALEGVAQIKQYHEKRINPLEVLELLSAQLPDDVSVTTLKIEDQTVELTAEADNAAAIIQQLSELKQFSEVRSTRPVQQVARANKERFTVEMQVTAQAFNVKYEPKAIAPPTATEPLEQKPDSTSGAASEVPPNSAEQAPPNTATEQTSTVPTPVTSTGDTASPAAPAMATATRRPRGAPSQTSGVAPTPDAPSPIRQVAPPKQEIHTDDAMTPASESHNDTHEIDEHQTDDLSTMDEESSQ